MAPFYTDEGDDAVDDLIAVDDEDIHEEAVAYENADRLFDAHRAAQREDAEGVRFDRIDPIDEFECPVRALARIMGFASVGQHQGPRWGVNEEERL